MTRTSRRRKARWSMGVLATAATMVSGAIGLTGTVSSAAPTAAPMIGGTTLEVGSQILHRCGLAPRAYCGRLAVPLDRSNPGSPAISVAYRWYPATHPNGGVAEGTVVPVEGGPGYPSTGSVGGFDAMYGPVLAQRNLLAVDLRGTGASTPVTCPGIQGFTGRISGPSFAEAAGACGALLNHTWTDASGRPVAASDLFTSAQAAADVAGVVRALGVTSVDLYGDSYGSWFAQVFANRYPQLLRSVILDSTYSTVALDPWYRSSHSSMPAAFNAACTRSPSCASSEPEPAWSRIGELAALLRRHPAAGNVPDATGHTAGVTMDVVGLVDLVSDAAGDAAIYRSLDAAARALLLNGDPDPLLRLYAQRLAFDESYSGQTASSYSGGLYLAVSCVDYPQLFLLAVAPSVRRAQLAGAVDALPTTTFAPFTTLEWLRQDQNTEAYTSCRSWPTPAGAVPPTTGVVPLLPPDVPVLVMGGEFDSWTPPVDHRAILAEVGGHARFVGFANATHVVGQGDQPCASTLVRAFVDRPSTLDSLDTSCASSVPPLRSLGTYPASLDGVPPLTSGPGNHAGTLGLQLGAVAVATAGDAVARVSGIGAVDDIGLHGGSVVPTRGGNLLALAGDWFVPGVPVSGTVTVGTTAAVARLTVTGPDGVMATVTVRWPLAGGAAAAQVSGTVGGAVLIGSRSAP
jgi:pimeloyl-ACP methyl ester carboxylesterase